MCTIKSDAEWGGTKKQMAGTLHTSTVCHCKTAAVHKYLNSTKHSCTTGHTWVLPKYVITPMHSALTIYSTMYHNEELTYIIELWMLLTIAQEMSL
jgi:hypothetical protein